MTAGGEGMGRTGGKDEQKNKECRYYCHVTVK